MKQLKITTQTAGQCTHTCLLGREIRIYVYLHKNTGQNTEQNNVIATYMELLIFIAF